MWLDVFFFLLAVWICSSVMTAMAIKAERERIARSLIDMQEETRKRRVGSLYGRHDKEVDP